MSSVVGVTDPVLRALAVVDPVIAAEVAELYERAVAVAGIEALMRAHVTSLAMGSRD